MYIKYVYAFRMIWKKTSCPVVKMKADSSNFIMALISKKGIESLIHSFNRWSL